MRDVAKQRECKLMKNANGYLMTQKTQGVLTKIVDKFGDTGAEDNSVISMPLNSIIIFLPFRVELSSSLELMRI